MCTAINYITKTGNIFGRNLDVGCSYNERIVITPRKFPLKFRFKGEIKEHYAITGMATVMENYPLYLDGVNEKGLCGAGLNFPDNAHYKEFKYKMDNIAPFEFIPWVLSQCRNIEEARKLVGNVNLVLENFSKKLPLTPLHFIFADKCGTITVESVENGLFVYDNPIGVLTNNPTFPYQLFNLNNYMKISAKKPNNNLCKGFGLKTYSYGMGGLGLPGDLSSMSRFVRGVFVNENAPEYESLENKISHFFHMLDFTMQPEGCVREDNMYEKTLYSSCCNGENGAYFYKTYNNSRITMVDMNKEDINGEKLICYKLRNKQDFYIENQ